MKDQIDDFKKIHIKKIKKNARLLKKRATRIFIGATTH